MRENQFTTIVGTNVILVPYEDFHVPKYHGWMKDPELQVQTASEALTLQEEYAMQRTWREDADKCTFIVLDRKKFEEYPKKADVARSNTQQNFDDALNTPTQLREIDAMIGDVNLFFIEEEDDDDIVCSGQGVPSYCNDFTDRNQKHSRDELTNASREESNKSAGPEKKDESTKEVGDSVKTKNKITGECELMIAEKDFRGQGRGKEALLLMLHYGVDKLNVDRFVAKIGADNSVSQNLFNRIGFRTTKFNEVFEEVTMKADSREEMLRAQIERAVKGAKFMTRKELHALPD